MITVRGSSLAFFIALLMKLATTSRSPALMFMASV